MTTYTKRAERYEYHAEVFDGIGVAHVYIVDGYGRHVAGAHTVYGVHTATEAIAAARAEGFRWTA